MQQLRKLRIGVACGRSALLATACGFALIAAAWANASCVECPAGSRWNVSQPGCSQCGRGRCTEAALCAPCQPGTNQSSPGQSDCPLCPVGLHQPEPGRTSCEPCAEGEDAPARGAVNCTLCRPGFHKADRGPALCIACPPGSHATDPGSLDCDPCPAGQFGQLPAQPSCHPCPAGTFNNLTGVSTCSMCQGGREQKLPGGTECTACARGFFKTYPATADCELCPLGYYTHSEASLGCIRCPAGYYCLRPWEDPQPCPDLSVCPAGSYEPVQCRGPFFAPNKGTEACWPTPSFYIVLSAATVVSIVVALAVVGYARTWRRRRRLAQAQGERVPLTKGVDGGPVYSGL